jgi:hypothetical protein
MKNQTKENKNKNKLKIKIKNFKNVERICGAGELEIKQEQDKLKKL